jgi:hypothetical protein
MGVGKQGEKREGIRNNNMREHCIIITEKYRMVWEIGKTNIQTNKQNKRVYISC